MAVPRGGLPPRRYPRHNLPTILPLCLGREVEEDRLLRYLRTWETRFAITGPGGIGKSALALKIGRRFVDQHAELPKHERFAAVIYASAKRMVLTVHGCRAARAPVATMRDLYRVVMRTLGLKVRRASSVAAGDYGAAIYAAFNQAAFNRQRQPVLLILDDFEDVVDAELRAFAESFGVDRNPDERHKLIVASRTTQNLGPPVHLLELHDLELDAHVASEWQQRGVDFDADLVRDIVQEVCGLPLAVWLAIELGVRHSARAALTRLTAARARLDQYVLGEMVSRLKAQHPRSYHLLLTLAFFDQRQGATKEQLAGMLRGETVDSCSRHLDVLTEQNLVYLATTGTPGDPRYAMVPHIRRYALAEGRRTPEMRTWEAEARWRWRAWFEDVAQKSGGRDQRYWSDHFGPIAEDWLNFRAVMDWCMEHGEYETLQELLSSRGVEPYTDLDGPGWPYRLRVLDWLIGEAERRGDWLFAVAMRSCAGWTHAQMGRLKEAEEQYRMAWRHRKDAAFEVQCGLVSNLAELHLRQAVKHKRSWQEPRMRASRAKARAQLRLHGKLLREIARMGAFRPDQMARQMINELYYNGWLHIQERQLSAAKACFFAARAIAVSDDVAFERARDYADTWLGFILMREHDYVAAASLLRQARHGLDLNGDLRGIARVAYVTALIEAGKWQSSQEDCLDRAIVSASEALALYEQLDMRQERESVTARITILRASRIGSLHT